jgi:hypothetical protein
MAFPTFIDEVAFASKPFDSPQIWTDLTARTRKRAWNRGRQTENEQADTGSSRLEFQNLDRALDPENTASVYSPNVLPMRRTRSRATFDSITFFPLFSTFIDPEYGWQLEQDETGASFAIPQGKDGFDLLSTANFSATDSFPQQTPGARITAILDLIGWPVAERSIDTSAEQQQIQAAPSGSLTGDSALDAIQEAAETEDGVFFIDGRGFAIFHDRYHRLKSTRSTTSQGTFCDHDNYVAGRFLYKELAPSTSRIVNEYLVTRAGGTEQQATDATSIAAYRRRSRSLSTVHLTDADALSFGKYKLTQTKDPQRRYDELVLQPGDDSAMWLQILNREIGDRITVIQTPVGGGAAVSRDMYIEGIGMTVGPGVTAEARFRLSPASAFSAWVLGDAVYGLLGQTTRLVY